MRKGRIFEQIVSLVEQGLKTDENTIIKHDVSLTDLLGNKRQIDVYITSLVSDHEISIAIECRDYKKNKIKIDDIEAFDIKTRQLAINKRIFVTNVGYQSGAVNAAEKRGIDLYTLSDLSPALVKSWLQIPGLQLINQLYNFTHVRFNLNKNSKIKKIDGKFDIESSLYLSDKKTKVTTTEIRQNLFSQLAKKKPDFFEEGKRKKVTFNFPRKAYYLKYKDEFDKIANIEAIVEFKQVQKNHPVTSIQQYSKAKGKKLAQVVSIEFPAMQQEFIMSFVKSEKNNLTRIVVAPKKK